MFSLSDAQDQPRRAMQAFVTPEMLGSFSDEEDISGYDKKSSWDIAVRYQDIKRLMSIPDKEKEKLSKRAVEGVLQRARQILGPVSRLTENQTGDLSDYYSNHMRGELDLLETLDAAQFSNIDVSHLRFQLVQDRSVRVTMLLDASLSMNGEKIALLALTVAVVALVLRPSELSLVSFSSKANNFKKFSEELSLQEIILRTLNIPAYGLTNLEGALTLASQVQEATGTKHKVHTVLLSDGKYTEGGDPAYLSSRFHRLHCIKLGKDIGGMPLLKQLSKDGNGKLFEVRHVQELPKKIYGILREILRV